MVTVKAAAIRAVAAAVTVVVSGIGLTAAVSPAAAAPTAEIGTTMVLDRQHADAISVRQANGALVLQTRADLASGAGQVLAPEDVTFHVSDAQQDRVPALPAYGFLGEPGAQIWKISQSYQPEWLWAGWEAESIPRGQFAGDRIDLALTAFDGPADVELYTNGEEGPERVLSTGDPTRDTIHTSAGAHTHANWIFSAAGEYEFTFVAHAQTATGQAVSSAPQSYRFVVGGAKGSLGGTDPGGESPEPNVSVTPTTPTTPTPSTPPAPQAETPAPVAATGPQQATPQAAPKAAAETDCRAVAETKQVSAENVDVVDAGHFDFGPALEGGTLTARVKDDRASPAAWIDPGLLVFHLSDAAAVNAPGGQFDFLGSGSVWQIPLTQKAGVPWLGWNTQHPTIAGKASGNMTLTLEALDGPGALAVYSVDSWGQIEHKYFGTVDGFPRSTAIEVGTSGVHVHGIWAFTAPGAYHATMNWSGTVDGAAREGKAVLTFYVGDGDPRSAAQAQTITSYVGRTPDGAECQLNLASTGGVTKQLPQVLALVGLCVVAGLSYVWAASLRPRTRQATN